MTSIQHGRRFVGLLIAMALVLSACGSSASSAPSAAAPSAAAPAGSSAGGAVSVIDFAFQPTSVSVAKGATVVWKNDGATPHTVTADDASFDSGNLDVGKTFTTIANTSGTIAYHCTIHPQMKATIVVAP